MNKKYFSGILFFSYAFIESFHDFEWDLDYDFD